MALSLSKGVVSGYVKRLPKCKLCLFFLKRIVYLKIVN